MNRSTSSDVHRAHVVEESVFAPYPMERRVVSSKLHHGRGWVHLPASRDTIDDRVEEGEDAVRLEVASLGHGTADDGGCGGREGQLEEKRCENGSHQSVPHLRVYQKVS